MDGTVANRHYDIYHISLLSLMDNITGFHTGINGKYVPETEKDRIFIPRNLKKKADCIAYAQMEQIKKAEGKSFSEELEKRFLHDFFIIDWNASERDGNIKKKIPVRNSSGPENERSVTCSLEELARIVFCRGVFIDGVHYVKFEQSGSMTRNNRVSFIRRDWYDQMEERITLGLQFPMPDSTKLSSDRESCLLPWMLGYSDAEGKRKNNPVCLSKWNAYKGLSLSDGQNYVRLFHLGEQVLGHTLPFIELNRHSVIVVPDLEKKGGYPEKRCWTAVPEGEPVNGYLSYRLVMQAPCKKTAINYFDGEGFMSRQFGLLLAKLLLQTEEGSEYKHLSSFQIRMPFIKGMLHSVDYKTFLKEHGFRFIKDIYGTLHPVDEVEMILTKSMFKACKWFQACFDMQKRENFRTFKEQGETCRLPADPWEYYWYKMQQYGHTVYISQKNQILLKNEGDAGEDGIENYDFLNYQVLHTLQMTRKEMENLIDRSFLNYSRLLLDPGQRMHDIIKGASLAPVDWGQTEDEDEPASGSYLMKKAVQDDVSSYEWMARAVRKNGAFLNTRRIRDVLDRSAERILDAAMQGRLMVRGQVRFLSSDLMLLLKHIALHCGVSDEGAPPGVKDLQGLFSLRNHQFYAPGFAFRKQYQYGIFRNPHVSENEHVLLYHLADQRALEEYNRWFGHLDGVLMIAPASRNADRMGGADYDGDIVHVIDHPDYNKILIRKRRERNHTLLPVAAIPGASPKNIQPEQTKSEEKYRQQEYELLCAVAGNQVGNYSNKAFALGARAYALSLPDNIDGRAFRDHFKKQVLAFTIYIGLEIDSVKSGIRPRIPERIEGSNTKEQRFLRFKERGKLEGQAFYDRMNSLLDETIRKNPDAGWKKTMDTFMEMPEVRNLMEDEKNPVCPMDLVPFYVRRKKVFFESDMKKVRSQNLISVRALLFKEQQKALPFPVPGTEEEKTWGKLYQASLCLMQAFRKAVSRVRREKMQGTGRLISSDILQILRRQYGQETAYQYAGWLDGYFDVESAEKENSFKSLHQENIRQALTLLEKERFGLLPDEYGGPENNRQEGGLPAAPENQTKTRQRVLKTAMAILGQVWNEDAVFCEKLLTNFENGGYLLAQEILKKALVRQKKVRETIRAHQLKKEIFNLMDDIYQDELQTDQTGALPRLSSDLQRKVLQETKSFIRTFMNIPPNLVKDFLESVGQNAFQRSAYTKLSTKTFFYNVLRCPAFMDFLKEWSHETSKDTLGLLMSNSAEVRDWLIRRYIEDRSTEETQPYTLTREEDRTLRRLFDYYHREVCRHSTGYRQKYENLHILTELVKTRGREDDNSLIRNDAFGIVKTAGPALLKKKLALLKKVSIYADILKKETEQKSLEECLSALACNAADKKAEIKAEIKENETEDDSRTDLTEYYLGKIWGENTISETEKKARREFRKTIYILYPDLRPDDCGKKSAGKNLKDAGLKERIMRRIKLECCLMICENGGDTSQSFLWAMGGDAITEMGGQKDAESE